MSTYQYESVLKYVSILNKYNSLLTILDCLYDPNNKISRYKTGNKNMFHIPL